MRKKYHVELTREQRQMLETLSRSGTAPARTQIHARILLKADRSADEPAWQDDAIVAALDVSRPTVERVRAAFVRGRTGTSRTAEGVEWAFAAEAGWHSGGTSGGTGL